MNLIELVVSLDICLFSTWSIGNKPFIEEWKRVLIERCSWFFVGYDAQDNANYFATGEQNIRF